jgi:hypothetical protein
MGGCYNPFCITRKGKKRVFAPVPNIFGGSMKKISTVLLVLVLVGSVAFAGFTGNAEVSFGADLDSGLWGFANGVEVTSDIVISETLVDNAGDGDIRAEITAELTFGFDFEDQGNENDAFADLEMVSNAEITSAKIIGDGWSVGILGAMGAPNFAVSALDSEADGAGDDDGDPLDLKPSNYVPANAGIEVGLAGYAFGLSIDNTKNALDGSIYNIFGSVTTPEYALADGITVALGAAAYLEKTAPTTTNKAASASAKVAYADDMLSATLSTDMIFDGGLMAEVAVAAAYDAYTLDVYFATDDDAGAFDSDDVAGFTAYTDVVNILSAKVGATVADLTVSLTGLDLVNQQDLTIAASYPVTDMLTVGADFGYVVSGASAEDWSVGLDATYTTDMYTLAGAVGFDSDEVLSMSASVESTTLVPGATLSLAWEDADYINSGAAIGDGAGVSTSELGVIVAKAVIAF